ncbi:hypothetical protein NDU88_007685 [Pleurodeles waltl]|uniref:Uncharacterized protein n=1 Tax=Pleurodeles waltl TaxID=8319 RepID=A0AAV7PNB1_PLEWA|nr:hypothetical protein NDU88_007685 [Pleurodeles waltl]
MHGSRLDRKYPGGTAQHAGVEVKPLRHADSVAQEVGPQQAGRRREEVKRCRQGNEEEEDVRNEEEVGNEEVIGDAKEEEVGNAE